jgi:hypothetical protein
MQGAVSAPMLFPILTILGIADRIRSYC